MEELNALLKKLSNFREEKQKGNFVQLGIKVKNSVFFRAFTSIVGFGWTAPLSLIVWRLRSAYRPGRWWS